MWLTAQHLEPYLAAPNNVTYLYNYLIIIIICEVWGTRPFYIIVYSFSLGPLKKIKETSFTHIYWNLMTH